MTQEQQREAIRILRVVAAASMGSTVYNPHVEEWIGWQVDEMEGAKNVRFHARKLLDALSSGDKHGE